MALLHMTAKLICSVTAISGSEKGGQWEGALALFHKTIDISMSADAMSFNVVLSSGREGEQCEQAVAPRYFTDARGRRDHQRSELHCSYVSVH